MAFINQGRHIGTVGLRAPETLGGLITYYGAYKIHTFLTSCIEFELAGSKSVTADLLLIGGGGGYQEMGGGGGGGMLEYSNFIISPGKYQVCVGAGGNRTRGESSLIHVTGNASTPMTGTISGTAVTIADAIGGGCHRAQSDPLYDSSWPAYPHVNSQEHGGSAAGSTGSGHFGGIAYQAPGTGIDTLMIGPPPFGTSGSRVGQGNDGGQGYNSGGAADGGGGGGAGTNGTNGAPFGGNPGEGGSTGGAGGHGGQGGSNSYRDGNVQWYSGGGGGGTSNTSGHGPPGTGRSGWGGLGGGGDGAGANENGDVNSGGGAHGVGSGGSTGGIGGSGIVVIRVPEPLIP